MNTRFFVQRRLSSDMDVRRVTEYCVVGSVGFDHNQRSDEIPASHA